MAIQIHLVSEKKLRRIQRHMYCDLWSAIWDNIVIQFILLLINILGYDKYMKGYAQYINGYDKYIKGYDQYINGCDKYMKGYDKYINDYDKYTKLSKLSSKYS